MDYIIVTVKFLDASEKELKVPTFITASELILMLKSAFNISNEINIKVHSDPPGRILEDMETMDEAGVWNGSVITLTTM